MDNIYGKMNLRHKDVITTGQLTVGHFFRRKMRDAVVNEMMKERMRYPKNKIILALPDVSQHIHLKMFFESAMNTDIFKIHLGDMKLCSDILVMRFTNNDYIVDLTLGEILLYMAEDLRSSYGGSRKYWLMVMFEFMGLEKGHSSNMGESFSDVAKGFYWRVDGGYGIFADPKQRITNKPLTFTEELARFKERLDKI